MPIISPDNCDSGPHYQQFAAVESIYFGAKDQNVSLLWLCISHLCKCLWNICNITYLMLGMSLERQHHEHWGWVGGGGERNNGWVIYHIFVKNG